MNTTAPTPDPTPATAPNAGLFRRLGAMVYDSLLLLAVLFAADAVVVIALGGAVHANNPLHTLYLLLIALLFYAGFWVYAGRTLGMQTWRLRITDAQGGKIGIRQAVARFLASLLSWLPGGLGYLWILWDPQRRAWHDRLSGTLIKYVPKPKR